MNTTNIIRWSCNLLIYQLDFFNKEVRVGCGESCCGLIFSRKKDNCLFMHDLQWYITVITLYIRFCIKLLSQYLKMSLASLDMC